MFHKLAKVRHLKVYSLALIGLVAAVLLVYFYSYRPNHSPKKIVTAGIPVKASSQTSASVDINKAPNTSNSLSSNAGGATDTHGVTPSTNSSQWTSSASGIVTVKSPAPSSTLQNGDTLSGSSSASEINYRLSDNKVGVIAQGTLSVFKGNFSGVLHFTPHGTGGRLDVFTTDDMGVEYNEVQINLGL